MQIATRWMGEGGRAGASPNDACSVGVLLDATSQGLDGVACHALCFVVRLHLQQI